MTESGANGMSDPQNVAADARWRAHVAEVEAFVCTGQSVSVVGGALQGRAILKRLMQHDVCERAGFDDGIAKVYLDCERFAVGDAREVLSGIHRSIARVLQARSVPVGEDAPDESTLIAVRFAFEDLLRRANAHGLRLVLLFDAFELLTSNAALEVGFYNLLRSLTARFQIAYVTLTPRSLVELTFSNSASDILTSPFFNVFASVYLDAPHRI